jgi:protein SCO1/2
MNPSAPSCEDEHVTGRSRAVLSAVAAALAPALLAGGCGSGSGGSPAKTAPVALHGAMPDTTQMRPEFRLVDTTGAPYDFRARTDGRVTLLYAGYTHCPDECPTAMADVASALRQLPPTVASQVQVVFVTTDPWRDSAKVLRSWLDTFHPPQPYVGLTGTPTQIAGAEVAMGMPVATRKPAPKSYGSGKYAVSHFAGVLVYGRDDRLETLYPSGVAPGDIATDLQVLVKG